MSNVIPYINGRFDQTSIAQSYPLIIDMSEQGVQGMPNSNINVVERIEKTYSNNSVDTYTVFYTNGKTVDYQIKKNGGGSGSFNIDEISVRDNILYIPKEVLIP